MKLFGQRRPQSGLTLIEVVLVSALLSSMSAIVFETLRHQTRTFSQQSVQSTTQDNLRTWVDRMVKDVRRVGYDPKETRLFGIEAFSATEFRFTSDTNENGALAGANEYLGYRYQDGTLWLRQGQNGWRPILTGVGGLSFVYRDVKGNVVNTSKKSISFVEIAFSAQATNAAAMGTDTSPSHNPVIAVGSRTTTVSVPSSSQMAIYGKLERVAIRNPG